MKIKEITEILSHTPGAVFTSKHSHDRFQIREIVEGKNGTKSLQVTICTVRMNEDGQNYVHQYETYREVQPNAVDGIMYNSTNHMLEMTLQAREQHAAAAERRAANVEQNKISARQITDAFASFDLPIYAHADYFRASVKIEMSVDQAAALAQFLMGLVEESA